MQLPSHLLPRLCILIPLLFFQLSMHCSSHPSSAVPTACPAVSKCLSDPSTICSVLPIPHTVTPTLPKTLTLTQLRPSVWSLHDGWAYSLIIYDSGVRRLLLIDAPRSAYSHMGTVPKLTIAIVRVVAGRTVRRVDFIYAHRHFDHIGSMPAIYDFVKTTYPTAKRFVWGTAETRSAFRRQSSRAMPKITRQIYRQWSRIILVRGRLSVMFLVVGGHTKSDIAVYIRPSPKYAGVLHLVDLVTPGFAPFFNFGMTTDLYKYMVTLKRVEKMDFSIFSGGHGLLGNKSDVTITLKYTEDAIAFSMEAMNNISRSQLLDIGAMQPFNYSAKEYGNLYFFLERSYHIINHMCARKLVEKYGCILGGVAVASLFHCQTAYIYNRIEVFS